MIHCPSSVAKSLFSPSLCFLFFGGHFDFIIINLFIDYRCFNIKSIDFSGVVIIRNFISISLSLVGRIWNRCTSYIYIHGWWWYNNYLIIWVQILHTRDRKNCIWISATRRPIQLRTPRPNGKHAWLLATRLRPFWRSRSQRSGWNFSGSSKYSFFLPVVNNDMTTNC